jgi:hypothetical protein
VLIICILLSNTIALGASAENTSAIIKPIVQWERYFGSGYIDEATHLIVDKNGFIYVSVSADSYNPRAFYLLKYSPRGDLIWNKSFKVGGIDTVYCGGLAFSPLGDIYQAGGIYKISTNQFTSILIKWDMFGNYQWNQTWNNGSKYAQAYDVVVDEYDNSYVTGTIDVMNRMKDVFLLKYDSSSILLWNKTWSGTYEDWSWGLSLFDYDIYIHGFKNDTSADNNMMLTMKYDTDGNYKWLQTYGSGGYFGYGGCTSPTEEIYTVGRNPSSLAQIVKYDKDGSLKWHKEALGDVFGDINTSYDGNFIYAIGDETFGSVILNKYDRNSNYVWNTTWGKYGSNIGYGVAVNRSGEIYIVGKTGAGGTDYRAFIVKFVEVAVPEFSTVILPIATVTALFVIVTIRNRKKRDLYEKNY